MILTLKVCLLALVLAHMALVVGFVTSFFILPFLEPWYVALPLMTFMFFFTTSNVECKLTRLENYLRQKLGMKRIGGFVGHYVYKPIKIALGVKKDQNRMDTLQPS